jgi:hypothetical protein
MLIDIEVVYVHAIAVETVLARDSLPVDEVSPRVLCLGVARVSNKRTRKQHRFGYPAGAVNTMPITRPES